MHVSHQVLCQAGSTRESYVQPIIETIMSTNENTNTANEIANRQKVDNVMKEAMKESRQAYDQQLSEQKLVEEREANLKPEEEKSTMEKAGDAIAEGAENVQDGIHWAGRKMKESLLPSDSTSQYRSN